MRTILLTISAMLWTAAAGAQSAPVAFPDTHGADADAVCFMVAASAASKATDINQRTALSSEAGFYVSRLTARATDAALSDAFRTMRTAFAPRGGELAGFLDPCSRRFLDQAERLRVGMAAGNPTP